MPTTWRVSHGSRLLTHQVHDRQNRLSHGQTLSEIPGVLHLRNDTEESWDTAVCEDQGTDRSNCFVKRGVLEQFEVGFPDHVGGNIGGSVLNANSDGERQS